MSDSGYSRFKSNGDNSGDYFSMDVILACFKHVLIIYILSRHLILSSFLSPLLRTISFPFPEISSDMFSVGHVI